jgi:hypothetical protein
VKHFVKYLPILLLLAIACESDELKPLDIGQDYFPVRTGFYQIYTVNEILYSEVADPDTLDYQLKVLVVDSFPNSEGAFTYVLHRSKRTVPSGMWQDFETWSVRANDREVIVNQGNTPYVSLTFPLRAGSSWDGNKLNSEGEDEYTVDTFDEPFTAGGITFEKTAQVTLENEEDVIVLFDRRIDVYARDAGLIYKQVTLLNFCTQPHCIGQQIIQSGRKYKQEIIEYGYQ